MNKCMELTFDYVRYLILLFVSYGHTTLDIPDPIRTPKSSRVGPTQYCGGGPHGNRRCCMFFLDKKFCNNNFMFDIVTNFRQKYSPRWESNPRPQAYEACAITTMLHGHQSRWRDSNSRPSAYKADAITTMLHRHYLPRYFKSCYIRTLAFPQPSPLVLNVSGCRLDPK